MSGETHLTSHDIAVYGLSPRERGKRVYPHVSGETPNTNGLVYPHVSGETPALLLYGEVYPHVSGETAELLSGLRGT